MSFTYPGSQARALDHVTLQVRRGEFVAVIGSSGAGKSTLLNVMCAAIPHFQGGVLEGEVRVAGLHTRNVTLAEVVTHVGMVMQDPDSQLFNMYVKQELLWGLENRGVAIAEMERRLIEALPIFGLSDLVDRFCSGISGGQKQKVALAAVYLLQPNIMLLDAPTSMLDPVSTRMVLNTIGTLAQRGQTIVVVEEHIFDLLHLADRLILMDRGRIVADSHPSEYEHHMSMLKEQEVYIPQIWELCNTLSRRGHPLGGLPVSLDQAEEMFRHWLSKRNVSG